MKMYFNFRMSHLKGNPNLLTPLMCESQIEMGCTYYSLSLSTVEHCVFAACSVDTGYTSCRYSAVVAVGSQYAHHDTVH